MDSPLVSVIIPAYNAEKYIAETLESVYAQTYRPIEVIVVDDGSTDRTAEVVNSFRGRKADKIDLIYIPQRNSGPSRARNKGIKASKGKYIAFLDSDDLWPEEKLSGQVGLMESHPDAGLIFGDVQRFSKDGQARFSMFSKKGLGAEFFGAPFYVDRPFEKLLKCNYIPTGTVMVRRECHDTAGFFDEGFRLVEDMELWFRMARSFKIGYSSDIWEFKRDHETNLSGDNEAMDLSFIKVLEKLEREFSGWLAAEKISLAVPFSDTYQRLGYLCFTKRSLAEARMYFRKSFAMTPRFRTMAYWFAAFTRQYLPGRIAERRPARRI